jgi:enterochelin esterase-like enzyme
MMPEGARSSKVRRGVRRRTKVLLIACVLALAVLGSLAWVGHNYYVYRTFTGDPNTYTPGTSSFGTVKTRSFYSKALRRTMSYDVYLPPGYGSAANRSVRFPVIYLLHGVPGSYWDWVSVGGLDVRMDNLLAQREIRSAIVVMPQGSPSRFATSTEYVDGPEGRWATYLTRDLVEHVDSTYRTVASRDGRAIAGLSEGAYGAMNLGLKSRGEFGVIGSFSGYFVEGANQPAFDGDEKLAAENSPALYLPKLKGPLPRIYFYVGEGEGTYTAQNRGFARELRAKGASFEFRVFPGSHTWSLWRNHLDGFLTYASRNLKSS